jgi:hypothetical protein
MDYFIEIYNELISYIIDKILSIIIIKIFYKMILIIHKTQK